LVSVHGGAKQGMIQIMGGGGAKQRTIKIYILCRRYDWTRNSGYSNIETFPCMGGLTPLAHNKINMRGLSPPSP